MTTEHLNTSATYISIRRAEQKDFPQVTDLYYRYLLGDFVGYCGRRMFISYLNSLRDSRQGSLWCAVTEEGRVVGFTAGIIDQQHFNRNWLMSNLLVLVPLMIIKLLLSNSFRGFVFRRVREKLKGNSAIRQTNVSQLTQILAYSKWAVVDEAHRGRGDNIASRLLAAIEEDVKAKGIRRIYGFVHRTNRASIFMHLKNGWQVEDKNAKSFKLFKEL